jgi:hypothetical protein
MELEDKAFCFQKTGRGIIDALNKQKMAVKY